jgi:hypothetical protein
MELSYTVFPGSLCVRRKLARYCWLVIIDLSLSLHGMNNIKKWYSWHLLLMIWSKVSFPTSDNQFDAEETQTSFHNYSSAGRQPLHFRPEEIWAYVGLWILVQHVVFSQPDGVLTSGSYRTHQN